MPWGKRAGLWKALAGSEAAGGKKSMQDQAGAAGLACGRRQDCGPFCDLEFEGELAVGTDLGIHAMAGGGREFDVDGWAMRRAGTLVALVRAIP